MESYMLAAYEDASTQTVYCME